MRCCGNCFWSFSPQDEEELDGYSEYDINKPKAGDCCIGQDHGENYCCSHHDYIDGMEEYENYEDAEKSEYKQVFSALRKVIDMLD